MPHCVLKRLHVLHLVPPMNMCVCVCVRICLQRADSSSSAAGDDGVDAKTRMKEHGNCIHIITNASHLYA
jgi:hypothetical protein